MNFDVEIEQKKFSGMTLIYIRAKEEIINKRGSPRCSSYILCSTIIDIKSSFRIVPYSVHDLYLLPFSVDI